MSPHRSGGRRAFLRGGGLALALAGVGTAWLIGADHDEAPGVQDDQAADIADVYAWQSPTDPDNVVLALTLSDVIPPGQIELGRSIFDPRVLYQFKIDNDGDAVEDLVIQAYVVGGPNNQQMKFRGPAAPEVTGADNRVVRGPVSATVRVTTGAEPIVSSRGGMTVFAGLRDDPFFFDFGQFTAILAGQATSFDDPGTDSFAGLNTYAIVVELPKSALPNIAGARIWATTSR